MRKMLGTVTVYLTDETKEPSHCKAIEAEGSKERGFSD
jgi:hypothetical protein